MAIVILENIITDPRYNEKDKIDLLGKLTMAEKILYNPVYKQIMSPDFLKTPDKKQQEMFDNLPQLKELNISLQDIINLLKTYNNLEKENLIEKISKTIQLIVKNQKNGRWDNWISNNIDENLNRPNAWAHCVLTRALIKWKSASDQIPGLSDQITGLEEAIKEAANHVDDGDFFISENNLFGWTDKKGNTRIKIYDTSFALTTISSFPTSFTKNLFSKSRATLLDPVFYNKEEGYWSSGEREECDTGATAHVLLTFMQYSREDFENEIRKGVDWLMRNQHSEGGWSQKGKQDNKPRIDRTCYALQTLVESKYEGVIPAIDRGINFLEGQLRLTFKGTKYRYWSWLDDEDTNKTSIPNSSYAISTLLRCNIPCDNFAIENGMIGLFIMLENNQQLHLNFICALIDYLKIKYHL